MKIASYYDDGGIGYGVIEGARLIAVSEAFRLRYPSLKRVLAAAALKDLQSDVTTSSATLALEALRFAPPLHDAERVHCVGINYPKRHPLGGMAPPPENIILFAKLDGALVGHGAALEIPPGDAAETFDYEGEIALVIGKPGRAIARERAFEHVAGYTVMNDGSVRGWQKHSVHAGKNFARSGACGPWMATADQIADPMALTLETRLNGETVQRTTAAEMIFSIPEIIEYVSTISDLRPGDLIATGSPEGAGASRQPPRFLRAGDALEIEVSGVGALANRVGG